MAHRYLFRYALFLAVFVLYAAVSSGAASAQANRQRFDPLVEKMERDARASITQISAKELKSMMDRKEKFVLIDVREKSEYDAGHIKGAILIPRGIMEWVLTGRFKDRSTPIVFYCQTGARSSLTTKLAKELGYTNVKNARGSIKEWTEEGFEIYNRTGAFTLTPKGYLKRER